MALKPTITGRDVKAGGIGMVLGSLLTVGIPWAWKKLFKGDAESGDKKSSKVA